MSWAWLYAIRDGAADWLPAFFIVMLTLMIVLMWRMMKLMPQIKPAQIEPGEGGARAR